MVSLKGHVNPNARTQDDQGLADPALEIAYATVFLKPTPEQQSALDELLIEQQDSTSPNYHRWLTPEEYGDRFGLSRADVRKIVAWLESQGLKVNDVARGRHWITFSGSAANVSRAFRTEIHRYITGGEKHFANAIPPSVPEVLGDVVSSVEGLDDYYPINPAPILRPEFTNSSGAHALAPDDLATIYNLKPLYTAGFDGTGQTIAVLGASDVDLSSIRAFRNRFNLPANDPKMMLIGPDPGTTSNPGEAHLDLEWSGAVARNATLIFVYARSVNTAAQYAVDQRVAPVITESFGWCEQTTTPYLRALAQQANAEGITWMASTGDVGAAGCERQARMQEASKGPGVQTPASIPEITAVGGTEFDDATGTYWNSTVNSDGGSAISYIPERAWNDSTADGYLAATTGGASIFYPKPWWQSAPGVPNDNARDVPDVAMNASWTHVPYIMYLNGVSGSNGGTSAAAPSFAGFVAILNQYLMSKGVLSQPGLGNINPTLYRLARTTSDVFHDIVNGDNIVPCIPGTGGCVNGSLGYSAGPGYDLATGLGSIDAYKLATSWSIAAPSTTAVTASPATIGFNGGNIKLTATVSSSGGTPAGDVTFLLNDTSIGTATLSASGASASASITVSAMQFAVGTNTVTAAYGGSTGLNPSAGTATLTITVPAATSAVTATVSPNPVYQHLPDSSGNTWSCTVRLKNQAAVSATLTKFTIAGTDYSSSINSWFGTSAIPANGSISTTIHWKTVNAPVDRVFAFSGADASGTAWSQQVTVSFVAITEPFFQIVTPSSVAPDPAADSSCRWPEPLIIEELGGYDVQLTTLTSGSTDFSSQLQQIFGTTTLAPFGRLQGTLCWDSGAAAGSKGFSLTGWLSEWDSTDTRTTNASTNLSSSSPAGIKPSVSPATVKLSNGSSQRPTATVTLSFSSGSPQWSAKVSPANSLTSWLAVSPASGTGAAQLTVTASAAGLSTGVYNATVLLQAATASPQFTSIPVALVIGGSSGTTIGGVTNAASYKTVFAPGMLMTVFGTNLGPAIQHAPSVPLPLTMQGVSATVNGFPAPLLDVTPGQLNIQIPYETGAGTAILGVNNNGQVAYFPFQVQASAPGIFMTLDGSNNLVPYASGQRGQVLLAFITGEGDVAPALYTGRTPTTSDVTKLPQPTLPAAVTVGGVQAPIYFIGIPRGLVGVTQINFTIPPNAPIGKQPVVVTVGGVDSAPVYLNVTQ